MVRTEFDVRQEQAEARRILVGQADLFAEVGVAVTAMGAWGVQFQVGDNLVVDQGDVAFARMVTCEERSAGRSRERGWQS